MKPSLTNLRHTSSKSRLFNARFNFYDDSNLNFRRTFDRPKHFITTFKNIPAILSRKVERIFNLLLGRNYFDAETIKIRYKKDRLDANKWCLVYNEPVGTSSHNCALLIIGAVLYTLADMTIDYRKNGEFTNERYIRLYSDFIQFGPLSYLFVLLWIFGIALLMRIRSLHLSKIYMNRQNPNELFVHGNWFIVRRWAIIDRKEVIYIDNYYEGFHDNLRLINGDAQFGKMGRSLIAESEVPSFILYSHKKRQYLRVLVNCSAKFQWGKFCQKYSARKN